MTTGTRFMLPFVTVVDSTGAPIPGAQLFFYVSQTNIPLNSYADAGLTTPNANPVQANAAGTFPPIFLIPTATYKVVLTDSVDDQIWTADPVIGQGICAPAIQRAIRSSSDLPIQATDQLLNIGISGSLAITVPLASGRSGAAFTFKNLASSTAVATLAPTSPDHFDLLSSIALSPGQAITLVPANDGVNAGYMIE